MGQTLVAALKENTPALSAYGRKQGGVFFPYGRRENMTEEQIVVGKLRGAHGHWGGAEGRKSSVINDFRFAPAAYCN